MSCMPMGLCLMGMWRTSSGMGRNKDSFQEEEEEQQIARTVEVIFYKKGFSSSPSTQTGIENLPYACNMTVIQQLQSLISLFHLVVTLFVCLLRRSKMLNTIETDTSI